MTTKERFEELKEERNEIRLQLSSLKMNVFVLMTEPDKINDLEKRHSEIQQEIQNLCDETFKTDLELHREIYSFWTKNGI